MISVLSMIHRLIKVPKMRLKIKTKILTLLDKILIIPFSLTKVRVDYKITPLLMQLKNIRTKNHNFIKTIRTNGISNIQIL